MVQLPWTGSTKHLVLYRLTPITNYGKENPPELHLLYSSYTDHTVGQTPNRLEPLGEKRKKEAGLDFEAQYRQKEYYVYRSTLISDKASSPTNRSQWLPHSFHLEVITYLVTVQQKKQEDSIDSPYWAFHGNVFIILGIRISICLYGIRAAKKDAL